MLRKITLEKITLIVALLIFSAAAISLPFAFSNTASAPSADVGGGGWHAPDETRAPDETGFQSDTDLPAALDTAPDMSDNDDFFIVQMDASDISRGSLILVNNENSYDIPEDHGFVALSALRSQSYMVAGDDMLLSASLVWPLNDMMDDFSVETGNESMVVVSAFRDYEKQQETLNEYIALMGYHEALRWAAPPGYSEHQSGLAVDFGVYSGGEVRTFSGSGVYAWFSLNSWKYGFILRFPVDKTDITETAHEPWHFRFVGEPHAYLMHENGWCLEEYAEMLMGHSFDEPYEVEYEGAVYSVYFTTELDVRIPFDCDFDISGNNIDGFIVTLWRPL